MIKADFGGAPISLYQSKVFDRIDHCHFEPVLKKHDFGLIFRDEIAAIQSGTCVMFKVYGHQSKPFHITHCQDCPLSPFSVCTGLRAAVAEVEGHLFRL